MDTLLHDLRYALRTLRRTPAFTAVAVLTLALGIGANTAIFSMVNAVLLRPLPYPAADRLVLLWAARPGQSQMSISVPDLQEWRARSHTVERIGLQRTQSVNLTGNGSPDRLIGEFVDDQTLPILGARTVLGRLFTADETAVGRGAAVAVISNAAWKTRFGADRAILGRTLVLNGRPHVVIGVLSHDFEDPNAGIEVYLPITSAPTPAWLTRADPQVWGVARLRTGVTPAAAQRDLASIAAGIAAAYPATNAGVTAAVQPLREALVGPAHSILLLVLGTVAFVLLIACANVASLMLARATAREREIAVRVALGAGRLRLVRQLLTESLLLSGIGGAAGIALAYWTVPALVAAVPGGIPVYGGAIELDYRVLAFSILLMLGSGVLFGAAPALFAARIGFGRALGSRSADASSPARIDLRSAFVAGELALCTILLVGTGLLVRSLQELRGVDTGFDPHNVLTAEFRLPSNRYDTPERIAQFMSSAIAEIRAVPGIRSAALARAVPLSGNWAAVPFVADNQPLLPAEKAPSAQENTVTDGFFGTMRIRLLRGRDFDARDRAGSMPVVIVNQQLANAAWRGQSPIGRRLHILGGVDVWVTVVGVVADVKQLTLGEPPIGQIYAPMAQDPGIFSSVVARTDGDPDALGDRLRAAIWRVDPDQPVWKVRSLESLVTRDVSVPRFTTMLTTAFALLALLLAAIGVYGVMAYAVAQRTRELGIRMALGAQRGALVRLVVGRGLRVILVAVPAGIVGAFAVARLLTHQLFGISAADPLSFVVAPAVLSLAALAAAYLPARHAARADPLDALRAE